MASSSSSPLPSLSISGITLASLLHHTTTSSSDAAGLLSGHLTLPPPPPLSDYDTPSVPLTDPASLFLTHLYSFPSPVALLDRSFDNGGLGSVVGWFSFRRSSSLRPSMREVAVSTELAKSIEGTNSDMPCVFLLLSGSKSANRAVHTHVYKAFVVVKKGERSVLEPVSLRVINIGPSSSGGQYGNFAPELSRLPFMPCDVRSTEDLHFNPCLVLTTDQKILDSVCEGFGVERLEKLNTGNLYTNDLEDLYCSMLSKLERLAKQVEKSSIRVSEQESRNLELRCKLAGME